MIHRYELPRFITRDAAQTLDIDVYNDAGVQQTATVGTFRLLAGSRELVASTPVSSLGPPATYNLLAADVPTTEALATDLMELWTLTIGGVARTYQRPAYLVRREVYPTITDTDLLDYHTDLADVRDPANTTFQGQRAQAWTYILKRLIERGRFPQLILDDWALRELHVYKSLELIYRDAAQEVGDGRFLELANEYKQLWVEAWDRTNFRYDEDEEGHVDEDDPRSAAAVVFLVG